MGKGNKTPKGGGRTKPKAGIKAPIKKIKIKKLERKGKISMAKVKPKKKKKK